MTQLNTESQLHPSIQIQIQVLKLLFQLDFVCTLQLYIKKSNPFRNLDKNNHILIKALQIIPTQKSIQTQNYNPIRIIYQICEENKKNIEIQLFLVTSKTRLLIQQISISFKLIKYGSNKFQFPIMKCPDKNAKIMFLINCSKGISSSEKCNKKNLNFLTQENHYNQVIKSSRPLTSNNYISKIDQELSDKKFHIDSLPTASSLNERIFSQKKVNKFKNIKNLDFLQINDNKLLKQNKHNQKNVYHFQNQRNVFDAYYMNEKQNVKLEQICKDLIPEKSDKISNILNEQISVDKDMLSGLNRKQYSLQSYLKHRENFQREDILVDQQKKSRRLIQQISERGNKESNNYKNQVYKIQRQMQKLSQRYKTLQNKLSHQKKSNLNLKSQLKICQQKLKDKLNVNKAESRKYELLLRQIEQKEQYYKQKSLRMKQMKKRYQKSIRQIHQKYEQIIKSLQSQNQQKVQKIVEQFRLYRQKYKKDQQLNKIQYQLNLLNAKKQIQIYIKQNKSNKKLIKQKLQIIKNYEVQIYNIKLQKQNIILAQKNISKMNSSQLESIKNQLELHKKQNHQLKTKQTQLLNKIENMEKQITVKSADITMKQSVIEKLRLTQQNHQNQINQLKALLKTKQAEIFEAGVLNLKKDDIIEQHILENEMIKNQILILKSELQNMNKSQNLFKSTQSKKFIQLDIQKNIKFNLEQLQELDRLQTQNKRLINENKQLYKIVHNVKSQSNDLKVMTPEFRSFHEKSYQSPNSSNISKQKMIDETKQNNQHKIVQDQHKIVQEQSEIKQKAPVKRKLQRKKRIQMDFETSNQKQINTQFSDSVSGQSKEV